MPYDRAYPQSGEIEIPEDGLYPEVCKYAAEARIFNTGKIIAKVRPAADGEETNMYETRTCDIWVDVFDSRQEAEEFCQQYQKA